MPMQATAVAADWLRCARDRGMTLDAMKESEMPEVTQALAQFAATLKYEDIPQRVREHCGNLLLDTLACAVAGHQGEETGQVAAPPGPPGQAADGRVRGG